MIVVTPFYAPDTDTSWAKSPGALYSMSGFVPLQRGVYGTASRETVFGSTPGTDVLFAKLFRQTSGSVRMLVFRPGDIDEYNSSGGVTNRATGLTTSTAWDAAGWGNRIIAVSLAHATQTSTSGAFSALGGGSPKAAHVAANENFVMLGNVDDSSSATPDEVWWCDIGNPTSWTVTTVGTQAGRKQLLGAPGKVTALAAFRDSFVAFKANSIFVGEYVGPPFFFAWRMLSNRVGCVASKSVVELDNKLYFVHTTGVWEYDGASLRNVSLPVFQSLVQEIGRIESYQGSEGANPPSGTEATALSLARGAGDDIEGVYHIMVYRLVTLTGRYAPTVFSYNVRSGLWSRLGYIGTGSNSTTPPLFVAGTTDDVYDFSGVDVRALVIPNANEMYGITYPAAADTGWATPQLGIGNIGQIGKHQVTTRAYVETLPGSGATPFLSCTAQGYKDSARTTTVGGLVTGTQNTEIPCFDLRVSARFYTVNWTVANDEIALIGGMGVGEIER